MKAKDSIDARKIQLVQRVLAINDPEKLDAIGDAIGSEGYVRFTEAEIKELERIRDGVADGSLVSEPWEKVRRGLLRALK